MPTGKLFSKHKQEPKVKTETQDLRLEIHRDFENLQANSKAYFFLMKRVSEMKDEAHIQCMYHCGEPIGMYWKAKLEAFDAILGIPGEFERKAIEAQEEQNLRSLV